VGFRAVQAIFGDKGVWTTMIFTHLLNRGGRGVRNPADALVRPTGTLPGPWYREAV
jgi:hypothetical protein